MVERRLEDLGRPKAALVRGTSLVLPRKENIGAAMQFSRAIVAWAAIHCMVLWIDNNNKWRCSRSICRKRDISINATCGAALPVPYAEGGFPPLEDSLSIPKLLEGAQDLPKTLQNAT